MAQVILNRIKDFVDQKLHGGQAGFWKNYFCVDLSNILRIVREQTGNARRRAFIYFEKAFNVIHRSAIWKVMGENGIPEKIANIIKETFDDYECQVIHHKKRTDSLPIKTGVQQGWFRPLIIFLIVLDSYEKSQWNLTQRNKVEDMISIIKVHAHK